MNYGEFFDIAYLLTTIGIGIFLPVKADGKHGSGHSELFRLKNIIIKTRDCEAVPLVLYSIRF